MIADRFRPYGAALSWTLAIAILLLTPGGGESPEEGLAASFIAAGGDKLIHFGLFAIFGWLFVRAFANDGRTGGGAATLVLGCALGALTEGLQSFVPGRSTDGWDLLADGLGALAGVALWTAATAFENRRRELPGC